MGQSVNLDQHQRFTLQQMRYLVRDKHFNGVHFRTPTFYPFALNSHIVEENYQNLHHYQKLGCFRERFDVQCAPHLPLAT